VGTSLFGQGTAVEALGDGRYRAHLSDTWNCPLVPHGGIVTATATRAMAAELGDDTQRLRTVHAVFAGQVREGDVEIEVSVLRRGRSMSQCSALLRNPGEAAGLNALAVFGTQRDGFGFTDVELPDGVNPPNECPSFRDPPPDDVLEHPQRLFFNFWEHVEGRAVIGHAPWDDYEPDTSLRAAWQRFDDPPRGDDGAWDPLAVVALCDTMPGSVSEKLGPSARDRNWLPPSVDLTVHVLDDAHCEWLLGVNRARHAGDGYASVDLEMWDVEGASPRLVAYATQLMFFSFR
jgi:acyl-CoA thioesterase